MKKGRFPDFRSPEAGISKSLLTEGKPGDQRVELRTVRKQIQLVSGKGCRILASFETLPLLFSISTCFHRVTYMAAMLVLSMMAKNSPYTFKLHLELHLSWSDRMT